MYPSLNTRSNEVSPPHSSDRLSKISEPWCLWSDQMSYIPHTVLTGFSKSKPLPTYCTVDGKKCPAFPRSILCMIYPVQCCRKVRSTLKGQCSKISVCHLTLTHRPRPEDELLLVYFLFYRGSSVL
jgi:hypothetical protein